MAAVYDKVYEIVCQIPHGRVLTYGMISHMLNSRLSAQGVGWALKALPEAKSDKQGNKIKYSSANVPWHRVINARGQLSTDKLGTIPPGLQRRLLEAEGVLFDEQETLDLQKFLWQDFK